MELGYPWDLFVILNTSNSSVCISRDLSLIQLLFGWSGESLRVYNDSIQDFCCYSVVCFYAPIVQYLNNDGTK